VRNVKLFLASSYALKKDRDEIMLFLANKNRFLVKHGIYLELVRWEFLSSSFSDTRKQDDFNKELEESEIFTCLIYDRVGQYTKEEFNIAYQNYKQGKNPKKLYLYFKILPKSKKEQAIEVFEFRKTVEQNQQIYREYKNSDQLKLFLNQNLDEDLPGILKEALYQNMYDPEAKPMTGTISEALLEDLDDADRMLNKNLTQEALSIYLEAIKRINKTKNPELYAKLRLNLGICYLNNSKFDDFNENLEKARFYIESALEYETVLKKISLLGHAYYHLALYFGMYSEQHPDENVLEMSIDYAEKALPFFIADQDFLMIIEIYILLGANYYTLGYQNGDITLLFKALDYLKKPLQESLKLNLTKQIALSHHFIGNTYKCISDNVNEDVKKLEYIQLCIDHQNEALKNINPISNTRMYSGICNNLAIGYAYIGRMKKDPVYLEKALKSLNNLSQLLSHEKDSSGYLIVITNQAYIQSEIFLLSSNTDWIDKSNTLCDEVLAKADIQTYPYSFGQIMVLKGLNLMRLVKEGIIPTEKVKETLNDALGYYENALIAFPQNANLSKFVDIQTKIAEVYVELSKQERKKDNIKKALSIIHDLEIIYSENNMEKDKKFAVIQELKKQIKNKHS